MQRNPWMWYRQGKHLQGAFCKAGSPPPRFCCTTVPIMPDHWPCCHKRVWNTATSGRPCVISISALSSIQKHDRSRRALYVAYQSSTVLKQFFIMFQFFLFLSMFSLWLAQPLDWVGLCRGSAEGSAVGLWVGHCRGRCRKEGARCGTRELYAIWFVIHPNPKLACFPQVSWRALPVRFNSQSDCPLWKEWKEGIFFVILAFCLHQQYIFDYSFSYSGFTFLLSRGKMQHLTAGHICFSHFCNNGWSRSPWGCTVSTSDI